MTESRAELKITCRKVLNTCIEDSGGKTIKLEIKSAPIIRMPKTIVTADKNAMSALYTSALIPVALAKFSSKVTAKILL